MLKKHVLLIMANLAIYIKIPFFKCDFGMKLYCPSVEGENISQAGTGKSKVYIQVEKM